MDITHADEMRVELRYIDLPEKFDAQISIKPDASLQDNTWRLTLPVDAYAEVPIQIGHYIYINGTEWGGPVERIKHTTRDGLIQIEGPTWRGMLMRKVVSPPDGQAYYTATGDARDIVSQLVGGQFGDLFTVTPGQTGVEISVSYRYLQLYQALEKSLETVGLSLSVVYDANTTQAIVTPRAVIDHSGNIDLSQDYDIALTTEQGRVDGYNHVIALGAGELVDRQVLDVYRMEDGTTTQTAPAWVGTEADRVTVYDYANAESEDELIQGAEDRLTEYAPTQGIALDLNDAQLDLPLGDFVGARDRVTGMAARSRLVEKILTIDGNGTRIDTRVGG